MIGIDKFPKEILVRIDVSYVNFLLRKIHSNFSKKKDFFSIISKNSNKKFSYVRSLYYDLIKKNKIPIWMGLLICDLFKIPYIDLSKNVVSYLSFNGRTWINKKGLEIKIDPVFDSIVSHLFFDGGLIGNGGKYTQTNEFAKNKFDEKISYVFGNVQTKSISHERVYIPKIIIDFIKKTYCIKEFSTLKSRLPESFKNKPKLNRVAVLSACIVDEGHVGDQVEIGLGNLDLLKDVKEICDSLGYRTSDITFKLRGYRFFINSRKKLYEDILELSKVYPMCDLAHKMEDLKFRVDISNNKSRRWGKTRLEIVNTLNKSLTAKQLSRKLFMTKGSVLRNLRLLEEKNVVRRNYITGSKGGTLFWGKL